MLTYSAMSDGALRYTSIIQAESSVHNPSTLFAMVAHIIRHMIHTGVSTAPVGCPSCCKFMGMCAAAAGCGSGVPATPLQSLLFISAVKGCKASWMISSRIVNVSLSCLGALVLHVDCAVS